MNKKNTVIGIVGPTACGKTKLACDIGEVTPVQIISVDSSMIYKGMDIGTAKPSKDLQTKYPHKLIDIREPYNSYSVGSFVQDVLVAIRESIQDDKLPLLVGGSMMYFHVLQNGLSQLPSSDPVIRAELTKRARKLGWGSLHAELEKIDPKSFNRIKPNDGQRIQRALEVYSLTQKPLSSFQVDKPKYEFELKLFGLMPKERKLIHARIAKRFHNMLEVGFIEEVQNLYKCSELNLELPSMRSAGYRQIWQYLSANLTYDEMCQQAIAATRQLAKRQLTWLRGWKDIELFDNAVDMREYIINNIVLR